MHGAGGGGSALRRLPASAGQFTNDKDDRPDEP
jgi:hypothetical protein